MTSCLLLLLLLLAMVSVRDVVGQLDCVSRGSIGNQITLCPGVYIVPVQPPLPPFFAGCNLSLWLNANQTAGMLEPEWTRVVYRGEETLSEDTHPYNMVGEWRHATQRTTVGVRFGTEVLPEDVHYENSHLCIKMTKPNMTMVTGEYLCLKLWRKQGNQNLISSTSPQLKMVLLADPSPVTLSVQPKQEVYFEGDVVRAQCQGVVGLQESSAALARLRLQYRQGDQAWQSLEWENSPHTVLQPTSDVGTRVQATNSQSVRVCALVVGCTNCVLSLRCLVDHELHVFEDSAATYSLLAMCQGERLRRSAENPETYIQNASVPNKEANGNQNSQNASVLNKEATTTSYTNKSITSNNTEELTDETIDSKNRMANDAKPPKTQNKVLIISLAVSGATAFIAFCIFCCMWCKARRAARRLQSRRSSLHSAGFRRASLMGPRRMSLQQPPIIIPQSPPVMMPPMARAPMVIYADPTSSASESSIASSSYYSEGPEGSYVY